MRRALVVGGTGFLGVALVDELLARGVEVTVTRRRRSITLAVGKRPVRWVGADLDEPASLRSAMAGQDVVFLAGAHYPRYSLDGETAIRRGVAQVEAAARAARDEGVRLVYTSSLATLARREDGRPSTERDVPSTIPTESVYRAAKWAMERGLEQCVEEGLDAGTLRPGGFVGPGDRRLGTGGLMVAVIRGELPWAVDGRVHLVDVRDVARAHVEAALRADRGERLLLGGHARQLSELLGWLVERFGGRMPAQWLTPEAARQRASAEERAAAPHKRRVSFPRELVDIVCWGAPLDDARARRRLGLRLRPLEESLEEAHAWFRRVGYLPRASDEQGVSNRDRPSTT